MPRPVWDKEDRWQTQQRITKALTSDPKNDAAITPPWTTEPAPDNVVAISPKFRFRHLQETETIQPGDYVGKLDALRPATPRLFGRTSPRFAFRPTRLQSSKYRFLDQTEVVQRGDEFIDDCTWRNCHASVGHRVRNAQHNRRRIDVPTTRKKEPTPATATELSFELGPIKQ